MKNHHYKLLVIDVDGTLIDGKGGIPSGTEKVIARVKQAGMRISLCTGRSNTATVPLIKRLSLDGYHIFFDGALVSGPGPAEEVYAQPLAPQHVKKMIDFAHEHGINLELFTVTRFFSERESWSTQVRRELFSIETTIVDFNDIWQRERIIKGTILTRTPEEVSAAEAFHRHFQGQLNFSQAVAPFLPGVTFVNVLAPGVTKGKALEALVSHLNIPLADVFAIGDGSNDIPLFSAAGMAVAMGNAPDPVKAAADYVTDDIEHNGLAKAIKKFLL